MTKEDIIKSFYLIMYLPETTTNSQIKTTRKYVLSELNWDPKKDANKSNKIEISIINKEYVETAFGEIFILASETLSNKKSRKSYDLYIEGKSEISDDITTSVNVIYNKYKQLKDSSVDNFFLSWYKEVDGNLYDEIYRQQLLRSSYIEDISGRKGFGKIKPSAKFALEYLLPNYWGYAVLVLTIIIFIGGITYGIKK